MDIYKVANGDIKKNIMHVCEHIHAYGERAPE